MDAKLKDALESKDYYSAHQIYIAIAQRHTRGKRFEEAKSVLKDGVITLSGLSEGRSAGDLAKRWLEAAGQGKLPLVDTDAIACHSIVLSLAGSSGADVASLAEAITKEQPNMTLVVIDALIKGKSFKEAGLISLKLEEGHTEWGLLGGLVADPHQLIVLTLIALRARNFAAVSALLAAAVSDYPESEQVCEDEVVLLSSDQEMARAINFCQLLSVCLQRRLVLTPSTSASSAANTANMGKLLQQFAGLLARVRVKEDEVRALENAFIHVQQLEGANYGGSRHDVLANLFQSMMANGGAPKRR